MSIHVAEKLCIMSIFFRIPRARDNSITTRKISLWTSKRKRIIIVKKRQINYHYCGIY